MISLMLFGLKSLLVLSAALLVTRKKWFTASVRHLILAVAMASLPALFVLGEWSPKTISIEAPAVVHTWALDINPTNTKSTTATETASFWRDISIGTTVLTFYALICSGLLLYWLVRILHTSIWITHTRVLRRASLTISGSKYKFTLRQSNRTGSPVTWGMFRVDVVVPIDWSSWPAAKQQAVLIHELSHVRRFDTFTSLVSVFISCLMWANPLVWLVHARLLAEAEHACDDEVIEHGIAATAYAGQLLEITRTRNMNVALAMASQSTLSRRIRALLDANTRRKSMTCKQAGTIICLALAVVLPMGTIGAQSATTIVEVSTEKSRQVAAITDYVFKKLGEIQKLIERKDYSSALELADDQLDSSRQLNGNEIGQYHSMRGFIYFSLKDYDKAIAAYKEVVAQGDDVPEGLEVTSLYTLAQLSFVAEHYEDALTFMELWITKATNPGPAPHYFMGQVYYQMKNYPSAIEQIELCIQVAQERGTIVKETWWVLLNFLYFEEENWDKVIEVLEILVQDFPKRDYWVRLAGIHGQLGNDQMQVQVMEAAYNAGFLDSEDYEKLVQSLRELLPKTNPPDDLQTKQAFSVDGDYLPIVTVAPLYPASARTAGIEGYVILEFEVTSTGAVANPIVIESSPAEVFDQAAVTAALKFKYKPRVVDGKPVSVAGIRNRINFELTD